MMSEKVVTVSRHHTINSIIDIMDENGVDRVIVKDGSPESAYVGMVTLDDLGFTMIDFRNVKPIKEAHRATQGGPKMRRGVREAMMVAEDVMSTPLVYVNKNIKAVDAAKLMMEHNYDMLPVIDGKALGEFNVESIIKWLSEARE